MNIVIFTDTFLPKVDGITISLDHFTRILAGNGHNFVICAPAYEKEETIDIHENVTIVRFKSAPLPSYPDIKVVLPSQKRLKKAMTIHKPDLIHIQTPGLLAQYGVLMSKMYKVPLIGTYHTLVSEQDTYVSLYRLLKMDTLLNYFTSSKSLKKHLDKIERKKSKTLKKQIILKLCNSLYETGKLIISPSELLKKELINTGVKKPIVVISNGMDLSRFKSDVKEPAENPRFLHVGRISFEKNCHVVIKAFALILEKFPEATLDIVGEGPAITSLKIQARQLEIESKINFLGFVPHSNLHILYPEYDVFLTASTMETQGLVVLEAMACALPVVGVDSFALPDLIHHNENGFVVEPFDHIEMAQKTIQIVQNPELYKKFATESIAIAQEHELHHCADLLEKTYQSVVDGTFSKKQ